MCPSCGQAMRPEITHEVEASNPIAKEPLRRLGVAPFDIVKVKSPRGIFFARLDADRGEVLPW
jgi:hypothetical protein